MANDANIRAVITAKDEASGVLGKFGDTLKGTGKAADDTTNSIGQLTKAFIFGNVLYSVGANVVVKFKEGLSDIVHQANEAAQTQKQLNAVIASTGGVAGVTAKSANELAESIRNTTAIDDDAALSAENMLLTFRDIGKNIFPQATRAVTDMATAMNGGMTPSAEKLRTTALQVGKALQDPILGVTTLRRVGVQLSDQQQQQVKDFIAVNDKASAQKVILDELNKEFGGSAAAAAETFSGKLQQLKNRMDDFGKSVVLNVEGYLNKNMVSFDKFGSQIADVASKIGNYLQPKFDTLWNTIRTNFLPAVEELVKAIGPTVGVGIVWAVGAAADALNIFLKIAAPIFDFLSQHTEIVWALVAAFAAWKAVLIIDKTVAAFQVGMAIMRSETLLTAGTMDTATAATGGLRLALLGVLGPWDIVLAIVGVAEVLDGIKQVSEALDKWLTKYKNSGAPQVKLGTNGNGPSVSGGSDLGLTQQLMNAFKGFATGGFTGTGGPSEVAGLVHKGEYVLPQNMVDQGTGLPKLSGNQTSINININAGYFNGSDVEARKYAKTIVGHIKAIANSKNMSVTDMLGA